jgi:hypothetical protein
MSHLLRYTFLVSIAVILMTTNQSVFADGLSYAFSFQAGTAVPTEDFSDFVSDDYTYGLSFEIVTNSVLGARITYSSKKFPLSINSGQDDLEMTNLALDALIAFNFPRWIRVFALFGPAYFSSEGQEQIGLGKDSKDIGLNGGLGFEVYPFKHWGFQLQSIYYSAEIGNKFVRSSWVESTAGFTFRF